LQLQDN